MERKADWYRVQEAECLALAAKATNPKVKAVFEDMGASWRRLAELADRLDTEGKK